MEVEVWRLADSWNQPGVQLEDFDVDSDVDVVLLALFGRVHWSLRTRSSALERMSVTCEVVMFVFVSCRSRQAPAADLKRRPSRAPCSQLGMSFHAGECRSQANDKAALNVPSR